LFRMPGISWFVKAFEAIPVYRKQDQADVEKNKEMFAQVRRRFQEGKIIVVFPEGTSHPDPKLHKLKTGAARMALLGALDQEIYVLPAGLFYERRSIFRTKALLYFGTPVKIPRRKAEGVEIDQPPPEQVQQIVLKMESLLRLVVLEAEENELIELSETAQQLIDEEEGTKSFSEEFARRKTVLEAYNKLKGEYARDLEELRVKLRAFRKQEALIRVHSLPFSAFIWLLLSPIALVSIALNYLPYRLAGVLSNKFSNHEEVIVATVKLIAGLLVFPIFWGFWSFVATYFMGGGAFVITLVAMPFLAFFALRWAEIFEKVQHFVFSLWIRTFQKSYLKRLETEKVNLKQKLFDLRAKIS